MFAIFYKLFHSHLSIMRFQNHLKIQNLIAIFLIFFGIFSITYSFLFRTIDELFWFCYIGLIITGIGILKQNKNLILSQINLLAIPSFLWIFDFIAILLTKKSFFNLATYFFSPEFSIIEKVISLEHLFLVPIGLFFLLIIKPKTKQKLSKNSWIISLTEATLIFIILKIIYLTTNLPKNINCVNHSCFNNFSPVYYPLMWITSMFAIILLTDFLLNNLDKK